MTIVKRAGIYWPAHDDKAHRVALHVTDAAVATNRCRDRSIAVQAGGNVGVWPLFLAERFDRVLTFEPEAQNFVCLMMNCAGTENIEAVNGALGETIGRCSVKHCTGNAGAHQVRVGDDVPMFRIDDLDLPSCGLIQLDVEGHEGPALMGAQETVARFNPVIMVELKGLGDACGWPDARLKGLLGEWGYRCVREVHRDMVFTHEEFANG